MFSDNSRSVEQLISTWKAQSNYNYEKLYHKHNQHNSEKHPQKKKKKTLNSSLKISNKKARLSF